MFYLNESEREYRHGDHGPKYLEQGPRMNFGVVMLDVNFLKEVNDHYGH